MKQKYPDNSINTIIENLSCSLGWVLFVGLVFIRLSKINKLVRNITRADKLIDLFSRLKTVWFVVLSMLVE